MRNDKICHISLDYAKVLECRRFGLSTFQFVDFPAGRRGFGLSTIRFVDVLVYRSFCLSTFQFVDVPASRHFRKKN